MKTSFNFLSILCIAYFFSACNSKPETNPTIVSQQEEMVFAPQDTITVDQFNRLTTRWEMKGKMYQETNLIKYFDMKKIDLSQFLQEQASGARFYIGLDSLSTGYRAHLLLLGVNANGGNLTGNGHHIYDYTTVCPPACPGINK